MHHASQYCGDRAGRVIYARTMLCYYCTLCFEARVGIMCIQYCNITAWHRQGKKAWWLKFGTTRDLRLVCIGKFLLYRRTSRLLARSELQHPPLPNQPQLPWSILAATVLLYSPPEEPKKNIIFSDYYSGLGYHSMSTDCLLRSTIIICK